MGLKTVVSWAGCFLAGMALTGCTPTKCRCGPGGCRAPELGPAQGPAANRLPPSNGTPGMLPSGLGKASPPGRQMSTSPAMTASAPAYPAMTATPVNPTITAGPASAVKGSPYSNGSDSGVVPAAANEYPSAPAQFPAPSPMTSHVEKASFPPSPSDAADYSSTHYTVPPPCEGGRCPGYDTGKGSSSGWESSPPNPPEFPKDPAADATYHVPADDGFRSVPGPIPEGAYPVQPIVDAPAGVQN